MSEDGADEARHREQIRVFPDYGAGWPVWGERGLTTPEDYPGLSPSLVEDLVAWQERWVCCTR